MFWEVVLAPHTIIRVISMMQEYYKMKVEGLSHKLKNDKGTNYKAPYPITGLRIKSFCKY